MEQLRQYVLSVAAAAILVGILTGLASKNDSSCVLLRMIGGLFLAFTVIRPVVSLDVGNIQSYIAAFSENGAASVAEGENLAMDAYCSYIKTETEAYILDKAEGYGADLSVEVYLDEGEAILPVAARLQGSVSPYTKARLQEMMEEDLGISKENQIWIG